MERNWENLGFGPYPVTVIPHYVHVLNDGTEIAAKLWLPWKPANQNRSAGARVCDDDLLYDQTDGRQQRFPVILEYLPYRKSDWTASRDHKRHSCFCSHGYVCVRADQRGSGDSSGSYADEYEPQEQSDCQELIAWLSSANWSNGRVGMYGKSWGGFNGLQVAYNRPPGLATVVSLYSTDNRFTDDIHYIGNCVMGNGMLTWSSTMQVWNARPMTPKYCDNLQDFKRRWKQRLEQSTECWAKNWLSHQRYDEYWKQGSICENYSAVECPVLIVGGLTDGYTNAAFRMAASLNHRSRAIIGPWNHDWPDISSAGPTIDFLALCLNWFDYYLKGKETAAEDVSKWPTLRVFFREPFKTPLVDRQIFDGTWYDVPRWMDMFKNFKNGKNYDSTMREYFFGANNKLLENQEEGDDIESSEFITTLPKPHLFQGLFVGDWISWDKLISSSSQNMSNKHCCLWTSNPLLEPLNLCGFSRLNFSIETTKPGKYALAAKLCHCWPDGECTLITYGVCNLNYFPTNNDNNNLPTPEIQANQTLQCSMTLDATTYKVPAGHKICLALCPSLFPILHPLPKSEGDLILHWNKCKLSMQILPEQFRIEFKGYSGPKNLLEYPNKLLENPNTSTKVEFELNSNLVKITKTVNAGKHHHSLLDLDYGECFVDVVETDFDISFCKISCINSVEINFKDTGSNGSPIKTKIDTTNIMTSDENEFHLNNRVSVYLNDAKFFDKSWSDDIGRVYV